MKEFGTPNRRNSKTYRAENRAKFNTPFSKTQKLNNLNVYQASTLRDKNAYKRSSINIRTIMNKARRAKNSGYELNKTPEERKRQKRKLKNPSESLMDLLDKDNHKDELKIVAVKPKITSNSSKPKVVEQCSSNSSDSEEEEVNEDGDKVFREKLQSLNSLN